jgi:membrane protease YdiL (CAAX protease family)
MMTLKGFVGQAILFEMGLGVLAWLLGWVFGFDPLASLIGPEKTFWQLLVGVVLGCLSMLPLFAGLVWLHHHPGPLADFQAYVQSQLVPFFQGLSVYEIGLISFAAGFGEELFFRGLLQAGLANWLGPPSGTAIGVLVAAFAFGCCHWLNNTYAALGTLVGLYLGGLFLWSEQLLVPMIAHGLYDFVAILYLTRNSKPPGALE